MIRQFRDTDYGVTRDGRVFRLRYKRGQQRAPREMKTHIGANGYVYFGGGNVGCYTVHRMVAEAWLPNPYNLPEVAHRDGVRSHVHADNLRWSTRVDNFADRHDHGTAWVGSKHKGAKTNEKAVGAIRAGRLGVEEAAKAFGMHKQSIRRIRRGEGWKHV